MVDPGKFATAVWVGDETLVREMLAAGANPEAVVSGGYWTPLHAAIENCQSASVRLLLAAGADVQRAMPDGLTPLMHAIDAESDAACQLDIDPQEMSLEITALLLAAGAPVTSEAIEWAERSYGSERILALVGKQSREAGPVATADGGA
jgi:ankyrin repeat protein